MTSSLFMTTVFASFFVVALPHVLPCPAPRKAFLDGEVSVDANGRRRRRRKPQDPEVKGGIVQFDVMNAPVESSPAEPAAATRRECPVPKPGGVVGELLGFRKSSASEQTENTRR
ncbi:hypothetical protein RB598_007215 [Gaeumannomyces tritici]